MSARPAPVSMLSEEDARLRPLYARVLGLRFVDPGEVLCFLFFEGTIAFAALLAMAELVSWWSVLILPLVVAVMVKVNDLVAEMVIRKAAQVPNQERERYRREVEPMIGRARVTIRSQPRPSLASALPAAGGERNDEVTTGGVTAPNRP